MSCGVTHPNATTYLGNLVRQSAHPLVWRFWSFSLSSRGFHGSSVLKTIPSRRLARPRRPSRVLCLTLLASLSVVTAPIAPALHAQSNDQTENNARKIVYRVEPEYPADLKRIGIGGYVRVDATISPSGTVEAATVAGGNPILAEAAVKALKKWKYAPMDSRTRARLTFHFNP